METFAEWLQKQMDERGYSQAELARRSDIKAASISRIMNGTRNIGTEAGRAIAIQAEIQNAWAVHSQESEQTRRDAEKGLAAIQKKLTNITDAIAEQGHSPALLKMLSSLEKQQADGQSALARMDEIKQPTRYTTPQLKQIAEQLKKELHGEEVRQTLRGLIGRIVAKRTDDQVIGAIYFIPHKVYKDVPPRGSAGFTLFHNFIIQVHKRKLAK